MLVTLDHLGETYRTIQQNAIGNDPVLIFVTPLCDSVCACHILTVGDGCVE